MSAQPVEPLPEFAALLALLGIRPDERVSINYEPPGGEFTSRIVSASEAPQTAVSLSGNIWFGVNPTTAGRGRGRADAVARVVAMYLDLDFKPEGLSSEDNARTLIDNLSAVGMPSAIVRTGGGLQPYYLLDGGEDVQAAARVLKRFERWARGIAEEMGLGTIDSVADVARVLRVPGTWNVKYEEPREVGVEFCGDGDVLALDEVSATLDALGVTDEGEAIGGEVVLARGDWAFRKGDGCNYVVQMVEGWKSDPKSGGRHPWLVSQAVRLAAAHRNGCLPRGWHARAVEVLAQRFTEVCTEGIGGPKRKPKPAEVRSALAFGVERVERKSDDEVADELGRHEHAPPPGTPTAQRERGEREPTARDLLIELCLDAFDLGRTVDDRTFIVERNGPTVALFSGAAKSRLATRLHAETDKAPGRNALDEAWTVIEGMAAGCDKVELPLRVGEHEGASIIDSGAADGWCIEVAADGWRVLDRSPITFRRSRATGVLPKPVAGGSLDALWRIVNVSEGDRDLVAGWLVSCLVAGIPHPILRVSGEQGAAKSTGCGYLGRLLDPSSVAVLTVPRDSQRWEVTANARWVIPVDNVSKIEPWWSDDLCRTSTGAGGLDRALYTDNDVATKFMRGCVILNGITMAGALRADLSERLLPVQMRRPSAYVTERVLAEEFTEAHPGLLGMLLDMAARTIAAMPGVEVPSDLRMADFAHLLAAFDRANGTEALEAFRGVAAEAAAEALDSDAVARAVIAFMAHRDEWRGSPAALLDPLVAERTAMLAARETSIDSYWPPDATRLGSALVRSGKLLRDHGIEVRSGRSNGARWVSLTKEGSAADPP